MYSWSHWYAYLRAGQWIAPYSSPIILQSSNWSFNTCVKNYYICQTVFYIVERSRKCDHIWLALKHFYSICKTELKYNTEMSLKKYSKRKPLAPKYDLSWKVSETWWRFSGTCRVVNVLPSGVLISNKWPAVDNVLWRRNKFSLFFVLDYVSSFRVRE